MAPLPGSGILAGRIGNFINGELWGKPTDAPWGFSVDPAVLHPMQAAEARRLCERFSVDPCVLHVHASQLYEGLLEGLRAVRDPVGVHRAAAAAPCAVRAVSALLRRVPLPRGIRARAGRESRLSAVRLGDDGPDPVHADDHRRPRAAGDRLPPQPAERQSADCRPRDMQQYLDLLRHIRERGAAEIRPHRHRHEVGVRPSDALRPGAGLPAADDQEAAPEVDRVRAAVVPEGRHQRALPARPRRVDLGRVGRRAAASSARSTAGSGAPGRARTAGRSTRSAAPST